MAQPHPSSSIHHQLSIIINPLSMAKDNNKQQEKWEDRQQKKHIANKSSNKSATQSPKIGNFEVSQMSKHGFLPLRPVRRPAAARHSHVVRRRSDTWLPGRRWGVDHSVHQMTVVLSHDDDDNEYLWWWWWWWWICIIDDYSLGHLDAQLYPTWSLAFSTMSTYLHIIVRHMVCKDGFCPTNCVGLTFWCVLTWGTPWDPHVIKLPLNVGKMPITQWIKRWKPRFPLIHVRRSQHHQRWECEVFQIHRPSGSLRIQCGHCLLSFTLAFRNSESTTSRNRCGVTCWAGLQCRWKRPRRTELFVSCFFPVVSCVLSLSLSLSI